MCFLRNKIFKRTRKQREDFVAYRHLVVARRILMLLQKKRKNVKEVYIHLLSMSYLT